METISQTPTNNDNKTTQIINTLNAILVGCIALGSFTLSYSSLRQVALTYGIEGHFLYIDLSYVWPLLIDGALVVFSLSVVSAYLRSESTWRQWTLVGLYTLVTVAFNILHAPNSPLAQVVPKGLVSLVVAMVAPTSLFFSFEMLMSQFKGQIARQNKMAALAELDKIIEDKQTETDKTLSELDKMIADKMTELDNAQMEADKILSRLTEAIADKKAALDKIQSDLDKKISELDKARIEQDKILSTARTNADKTADKIADKKNDRRTKKEQRQAEAIRLFGDDVSIPDIAKRLEVNERTIKRYLNGHLDKTEA